jgi:hypothetical protein
MAFWWRGVEEVSRRSHAKRLKGVSCDMEDRIKRSYRPDIQLTEHEVCVCLCVYVCDACTCGVPVGMRAGVALQHTRGKKWLSRR